ncbi:hypothetical protein [Streptomyces sp. NRRL F-5126]|uniref:hypothetical protein n=1 Tax=Streptomyces sp. NRRL F-5126 TaxID=1463857 RepID=UPI0004C7EEF9|nr:hypothetical protein [Streptomyces sp. NRRL F-5126]
MLVALSVTFLAALTFATPASAGNGPPWGTIVNHTGRHLGGAHFGHGKSECKIWNKYEDRRYAPTKMACDIDTIDPHTTTGTFDDMDGVTVRTSGYYYVRFYFVYSSTTSGSTHMTSYHKAHENVWTKFPGNGTANCYSGTHAKCTITVVY